MGFFKQTDILRIVWDLLKRNKEALNETQTSAKASLELTQPWLRVTFSHWAKSHFSLEIGGSLCCFGTTSARIKLGLNQSVLGLFSTSSERFIKVHKKTFLCLSCAVHTHQKMSANKHEVMQTMACSSNSNCKWSIVGFFNLLAFSSKLVLYLYFLK